MNTPKNKEIKLSTRQILNLMRDLQQPGSVAADQYSKYGAELLGVSIEEFQNSDRGVSDPAILEITKVIKMFS